MVRGKGASFRSVVNPTLKQRGLEVNGLEDAFYGNIDILRRGVLRALHRRGASKKLGRKTLPNLLGRLISMTSAPSMRYLRFHGANLGAGPTVCLEGSLDRLDLRAKARNLILLDTDLFLLFPDECLLLLRGFDQQRSQAAIIDAARIGPVLLPRHVVGRIMWRGVAILPESMRHSWTRSPDQLSVSCP